MNRTTTFILLTLLCMVALAACSSATPTPAAAPNQSTAATKITKLNLNTASGDEFLAAIPGLGSRMVREFQEYRPYISIQQFRREIGKYVDDAQVAEYENMSTCRLRSTTRTPRLSSKSRASAPRNPKR